MAKQIVETRVAGMVIKTEVDVPEEMVEKPVKEAPKASAAEKKAKA